MARSKSVNHYPEEYQQIVEKVCLQNVTIKMPVHSRSEAASLRGHFYAFVGALKREVALLLDKKAMNLLTEGQKDLLDKSKFADRVQVTFETVNEALTYVVFQNRENSWQAVKARQAIAAAEIIAGGEQPQNNTPPADGRELTVEEQLALISQIDPRTGQLRK